MLKLRSWGVALVCAIAAGCLFAGSSAAQEDRYGGEGAARSAEFLEMLKERGFAPKILERGTTVDPSQWPQDSMTGAKAIRVFGREAGLHPEELPGVEFISMKEVQRLDMTEKKTGLLLVDIDFVPRELPGALEFFRYTLEKDGTLLSSNGEPILALITSEVYLIEAERRKSALERTLDQISDLLATNAFAANPFPWRCYSFTPWAVYHSGFHRWYDARTWAGAYGADGSGGCSGGSPHTRIDYMSTRAAVGGVGDLDHCFNCESEYSRDTWDVGYFWPAHGVPVTTHSAVYADGTFSFSRTAHLSW